jgi:NhaP-type Na+/H+ or K+/H+ antiporter
LNLDLVRDAKDINTIRELSVWEILLLGACFCSIDTIASEEAISSRKFPKLFSIVFGEGILKDAVTIVLFRSILRL